MNSCTVSRAMPLLGLENRGRNNSTAEFIRLEGIHKVYRRGSIEVPVLNGCLALDRAARWLPSWALRVPGRRRSSIFWATSTARRAADTGSPVKTSRGSAKLSELGLRGSQIGFVFQNFNLLPRMTALENVMMPFMYGSHDFSDRECRDRARRFSSGLVWATARS